MTAIEHRSLDNTQVSAHTADYLGFLDASPSSYHAAHLVADRLQAAGFTLHKESEQWDASSGGHIVIRDGAVAAWYIPSQLSDTPAFRILGAHTDSPCLALKPTAESRTADGWRHINVEMYGGLLRNSWLDRELRIAGRIIDTSGQERLVVTEALARIPQLAIHLDREVTTNGLTLDAQQHMHPVWSVEDSAPTLMGLLATRAGLNGASDIAAADLRLVVNEAAATFGAKGEFIASARQDNLSSVHAGLRALEDAVASGEADRSGDVLIFVCFDHEEIGSDSRSGAAGPFLSDILQRTALALGHEHEEYAQMLSRSVCISADAAHSVHPNYADRHDPAHHPMMGSGPVLKVNANQRYATDAVGTAHWVRACALADVPTQTFVGHNGVPCGSTIGPITATRIGITTVDVGVPLLSMHSAREMSHAHDQLWLSLAVQKFFTM